VSVTSFQQAAVCQVQAAQRSQSGRNLFQASTSVSSSSHQPAATSSTSWATTSRPDVSLPRVASMSAQGSGVFAQQSNTDLRHSTTSTSQQLPTTSQPPLRQALTASPSSSATNPPSDQCACCLHPSSPLSMQDHIPFLVLHALQSCPSASAMQRTD